jgi:hypothetical protein
MDYLRKDAAGGLYDRPFHLNSYSQRRALETPLIGGWLH